ncbi:MAG TPA: hypothetical protein VJ990_09705 [Clostridia bacterium]|nr:hypothetical protein [Clostridia bacterium]
MNKKDLLALIIILAVLLVGFFIRNQLFTYDSEYEGTIKGIDEQEKVTVQIDAKKNNKDIADNHIYIKSQSDTINGKIAFYKRENGADAVIFSKEDGKVVEIGEIFFMKNKSIRIVLSDNKVIAATKKK